MSGIVGEDIDLTLTMIMDESIINAVLYFRERGEINFEEIHMRMRGNKWDGIIPGNVLTPNGLEYVIVLTTQNGGFLGTPQDNPFELPHFILIHPREEQTDYTIEKNEFQSIQAKSVEFL